MATGAIESILYDNNVRIILISYRDFCKYLLIPNKRLLYATLDNISYYDHCCNANAPMLEAQLMDLFTLVPRERFYELYQEFHGETDIHTIDKKTK